MFYTALALLYRMDRDESRARSIPLHVFTKRTQRESTSGFDCFSRCLTLAIIGEFGKHVKVFPKSVFRANNACRSLMSELYESFHFKHDSISNAKKNINLNMTTFHLTLGKSSTYNVL